MWKGTITTAFHGEDSHQNVNWRLGRKTEETQSGHCKSHVVSSIWVTVTLKQGNQMSVHYHPFQNESQLTPKNIQLQRLSACSQEQADSRKYREITWACSAPLLAKVLFVKHFFTELYEKEKQERKAAVGGGKGEIWHFPSALPEERQGGEMVQELAADLFQPDKYNWRTKRSNTWRSGKGKPALKERPRKYIGKEKKARRLCLLVESTTKETAKYIHQFKNRREAAEGLKKASKQKREQALSEERPWSGKHQRGNKC